MFEYYFQTASNLKGRLKNLFFDINDFDIVVVFIPIVVIVIEFVPPFFFAAERGVEAAFQPQYGQQAVNILRQRGFKLHFFTVLRMDETQAVGVQCLSGQCLDFGFYRVRAGMARVAVNGVARQRMLGFAHVDADLVGAAGFQRAFDVAVRLVAFQDFDVGNGFFAAEFYHRHFDAVVRVASDLGFDFAVERHDAVGNGTVDAFDGAGLQLSDKVVLRGQGFGHDHQSAGVFVQAVDDACARDVLQRGAVRQEAVEQRAGPVARRRVDDQSGGFVQDDDAVVFVYDVQIHGFGGEGQGFVAFADLHGQLLAADEFVFRLGRFAVYRYRAFFNPVGQPRAGVVGQQFGQRGIEPQAGIFEGDG